MVVRGRKDRFMKCSEPKIRRRLTILIFGRRRIGKSELIKQCLKETRIQSIYFECKQTLARSGRTWS